MAGSDDRRTKRSKLGSRVQRGIYKSAHGWKHPWWPSLCRKADKLQTNELSGGKGVVALNSSLQVEIFSARRQHIAESRYF